MRFLRRGWILCAAAALLLATPGLSSAAMKLDVGGVITADGDADGVITFNAAVGSFSVTVTTGISKPMIGSAISPRMDLNSILVSGGVGTIVLVLTDTDFIGGPTLDFITSVGGTTDGTVEIETYLDNGNGEFAQTTLLSDLGTLSGVPFSATDTTDESTLNPYSLTIVATITHTSAAQITSFDTLLEVPEADTLALMGLGIVGLLFFGRRRS